MFAAPLREDFLSTMLFHLTPLIASLPCCSLLSLKNVWHKLIVRATPLASTTTSAIPKNRKLFFSTLVVARVQDPLPFAHRTRHEPHSSKLMLLLLLLNRQRNLESPPIPPGPPPFSSFDSSSCFVIVLSVFPLDLQLRRHPVALHFGPLKLSHSRRSNTSLGADFTSHFLHFGFFFSIDISFIACLYTNNSCSSLEIC